MLEGKKCVLICLLLLNGHVVATTIIVVTWSSFTCSAGYTQTSESFLLKAREYSLPELYIEKAKHMRSEVRESCDVHIVTLLCVCVCVSSYVG